MDKLKLAQLKVLPWLALKEMRHFFQKKAKKKIAQAASNKTKGSFKNASSALVPVQCYWVLKNHVGTWKYLYQTIDWDFNLKLKKKIVPKDEFLPGVVAVLWWLLREPWLYSIWGDAFGVPKLQPNGVGNLGPLA